MLLMAVVHAAGASSSSSSAAWPRSVQPFFLSALSGNLTAADAHYLGQLPVVVINHKQGAREKGKAEAKQLLALSQVKAANKAAANKAPCATFFYLNSQIDFPELQLHEQFVANGSWWLRTDEGGFVLHGKDHIFDFTVAAARSAWLAAAQHALSQPYISGVFVDKAGGFEAKGVSPVRGSAWARGHQQLLQELAAAASASTKQLIFNNVGVIGVAGQLYERWGAKQDHDDLDVQQDLELLQTATAASNAGQLSLARAGGVVPGSASGSSPEVCGAGLAAMLLAVSSPNAAYFACMPDFNSLHGWMALDQDKIYQRYLGAPTGEAVVGKDGLITRAFAGANVTLNASAFVLASNPTDAGLNRGCVQWASGETSGTCP
jgi:hypothetical protein